MSTLIQTFTAFFTYFAIAVVLTLLFIKIYVKITPYNEFSLIKQGLIAPAISLSGSLLGFVIALSSVIKNSISLLDMVIWGVLALIIQLLAFLAVKLFLPTLTEGISNNNIAKSLFLAAVSLSFGLLNASCMTY